jgi:CubicO group peptidase (beta-lactamase class C family)
MNMKHQFICKFAARLMILVAMASPAALIGFTGVSVTGGNGQAVAEVHPVVPLSFAPVLAGAGDLEELEGFIDGVMSDEMQMNHIPGAVVAVVKDGELIFEKGYGYSDYENRVPVDPEQTLFRVGSISKLFIWTAVMQLVEQGKLSLDMDINTYLDFKIPATFLEPITMKNLMAHTAGFEGSDQGIFRLRPEELVSLEQYVKTYIPARVYPVGKIEIYSNYGAALASYIIERLSGMSFNDYIERSLLIPLGMTHSTFRQPLPAELAPDLASGYNFLQGRYVKGGFEYIVAYPVGSLSSTGADLARFMLVQLQNGQLRNNRILSEQTTQQMHSQLFTHDPRITGMAYGFYENNIHGQRVLSHGGGTVLWRSKLYLIMDQNIGLFISTNAPGGGSTRNVLFKKFMDHYYPAPPDRVQDPADGFSRRVAPYLGTYYPVVNNFTTFEKLLSGITQINVSLDAKNHLVFSQGNQQIQFVEVEPGLMRETDDANVEFVLHTDENGQAYLLFPDPLSSWIKAPWYGATWLHALLIGFVVLLFMVTLIGWTIAAFIRQREGQPCPLLSRLTRWTGVLFAVVLFVILAGWVSLLMIPDPVFDQPVISFSRPPLFYDLYGLADILAGLGVLMLVFASLGWVRHLWNVVGRLHYSLLALSGLSLLWELWYWNLL